MIAIKKVSLYNFMILKGRHEVVFNPHFTKITGPNNTGKTTTLTGIEWVLCSDTKLDRYMAKIENNQKDKGEETYVEIELLDGTIIKKTRVNSETWITINGKKQRLLMHDGAPKELEKYQLSTLNFQKQADNIFPVNLTPSNLIRYITKKTGIDTLRAVIKKIEKDQKKIEKDQERYKIAIDEINNLLPLIPFQRIKKDMDDMHNMTANFRKIAIKWLKYKTAIKNLVNSPDSNLLDKHIKIIKHYLDEINDIIKIENKFQETSRAYYEQKKLMRTIKEINKQIKTVETNIDRYQKKLSSVKTCPTCGAQIDDFLKHMRKTKCARSQSKFKRSKKHA